MQRAYIGKLLQLAEKDSNLLHLVADSGTGFDELFRRNFPGQMLNFGISEENMIGASAGLATAGKIPFVYTAGAFLAYRCLEFIRDDVCFQNLNVKIVGMGSGLSWSSLGPTHHTTEDVAVLRVLPNLMILSPGTPRQVAECVELTYRHQGPVYMRIGMNNEKEWFPADYKLSVCGYERLAEGADATVFVTGSIITEVMRAQEMLKAKNKWVSVVLVHCIKPFNNQCVFDAALERGPLITVEEHSRIGGLGSIVSEIAAQNGLQKKVVTIGLDDFAVGYGTYDNVRAENGLDAASILKKIEEALA